MDLAYWLQIVITLAPMLIGMGIVFEKVRQIEKRLNGDGTSIPGQCKVHEEKLDGLADRVTKLELEPLGD